MKMASAAWLLAAGGFAAFAAEPSRNPNRVWLGADFTANVTASFKQLGGSPARSDPGSPTGGVDHFYDDGYHRVDASGNADGTSWFWGYEQAQQLPGNDSLLLNSYSSPAEASIEADTDVPSFGFELGYSRELGQIARARWGLEVVFGCSNFDFEQRGTLVGDALRVTDAYDLGGVMVPQAPYRGTFEGPGPLIGDTPTRTTSTIPEGSIIDGYWRSEAALYGFRLGPYIQIPLTPRLGMIASGGFVGALVDADFSFRETITLAGADSRTFDADGSRSDWLAGGYVDARISVALTERVCGFLAARYQHLGTFSETVEGRRLEIDFRAAVTTTIGITYSF